MKMLCVHCGQEFSSKRTRKMCGACKMAKATQNWEEYQRRGKLKWVAKEG